MLLHVTPENQDPDRSEPINMQDLSTNSDRNLTGAPSSCSKHPEIEGHTDVFV